MKKILGLFLVILIDILIQHIHFSVFVKTFKLHVIQFKKKYGTILLKVKSFHRHMITTICIQLGYNVYI